MSALRAVLSAEWLRLVRGRSTAWAGAAVALLALVRVVAVRLAERAAWAECVRVALLEGSTPPATPPVGNAFGPLADGLHAGVVLGALLLVVHGARALAADDEHGIARIQLTRGASRTAIVLARTLLGAVLALFVLLLAGAGALVAAATLFQFGPVVEDGYELISAGEVLRELGTAVLATLPPLVAGYAFALAVSALARTSAVALVGTLVLLLGFDLFKDVLADSQRWVFAAYTPSFVDRSCLGELAGIARGMFDAGYPDALLRMNFAIPTLQGLVFLVVALLAYRRRAL